MSGKQYKWKAGIKTEVQDWERRWNQIYSLKPKMRGNKRICREIKRDGEGTLREEARGALHEEENQRETRSSSRTYSASQPRECST